MIKRVNITMLAMLLMLFIFCFVARVYSGSHDGYECNEGSCKNSMYLDEDNLPWPEGCTELTSGTCGGDCYRNQNSSATMWCEYKPCETCWFQYADKVLACGDKFKFACGGTWTSKCNCPKTGGTDTGENGIADKCTS